MSSGFAQIVIDIILKHAPDLDSKLVEMRPSKNGNFLSVTATVNATSKKQLDDIYRELSAHPLVLMAL
jgi:putative lipoic acid-binding regulatory protein